ncbi:MAG: hypothetical protein JW900_04245 [Anaerolineae bacterium]|nr:hypothetical protein [Anaerolineae bacterium]
MENDIQHLFDIVKELQEQANVNAVFGQPLQVEGRTVIPVAEVTYGFGLGFGSGSDVEGEEEGEEKAESGEGGGGGGGLRARPLGLVEVTPERIHVEPVVDEQKVVHAVILLMAWLGAWIAGALMLILRKNPAG